MGGDSQSRAQFYGMCPNVLLVTATRMLSNLPVAANPILRVAGLCWCCSPASLRLHIMQSLQP